jgi:hypothetical protein
MTSVRQVTNSGKRQFLFVTTSISEWDVVAVILVLAANAVVAGMAVRDYGFFSSPERKQQSRLTSVDLGSPWNGVGHTAATALMDASGTSNRTLRTP